MAKREIAARVHDVARIAAMVEAVDREIVASREIDSTLATAVKTGGRLKPRFGVVIDLEKKALEDQAAIVAKAKEDGYSLIAAEGLLMQGRAVRHQRNSDLYGEIALGRAPVIAEGKAKVKSDGKGQGGLKDRRRAKLGREGDIFAKAANGEKLTADEAAFLASFDNVEVTEADYKEDAADTGEWFAVA